MRSALLRVTIVMVLPLLALAVAQTAAPKITPAGAGNLAGEAAKIDLRRGGRPALYV